MVMKHAAIPDLATVVQDLHTEGEELYRLLRDMDTGYWTQTTLFKDWTVWDVLAHLHFSDYMALTSIESEDGFRQLAREMQSSGMRAYTDAWLADHTGHPITGPALLERWHAMFETLCQQLAAADPEQRFAWAGPGMKAKMFATARQMETWAHGWEIYDLMGIEREHTDRLIHIATIGVKTFGWTFRNRGLPVPEPAPYVELTAPSGELWRWNDPDCGESISGAAVEFCQVVTQVRNIADTQLKVEGDTACAWMEIAQCFAGPPETPPAKGTRIRQTNNLRESL